MRRLSAHYVLLNSQLIQFGTIVLGEQDRFLSIESPQKPYKEQPGVEFYNGLLAIVDRNYNLEEVKLEPQSSITTIFCGKAIKVGHEVQVLQVSPINMEDFSALPETSVKKL